MEVMQIIEQYYHEFNMGNWEGMLSLLNDDVRHDANQGSTTYGKDAFRVFLNEMAIHYKEKLHDIVIMVDPKGERAAAEFICSGTYIKTQMGLPEARMQKYQLPVGAFFEVKKGLITRVSNYYNLPEWIRQVKN